MLMRLFRRIFGDRRPLFGPPVGLWYTDMVLRRHYAEHMRQALNAPSPWLDRLNHVAVHTAALRHLNEETK